MNDKKEIGGISLDKWKCAFAKVVSTAIKNDSFNDILFLELYPNFYREVDKIWYEDISDAARDEAIQCLYEEKWWYVNEAFNEIFGFKR